MVQWKIYMKCKKYDKYFEIPKESLRKLKSFIVYGNITKRRKDFLSKRLLSNKKKSLFNFLDYKLISTFIKSFTWKAIQRWNFSKNRFLISLLVKFPKLSNPITRNSSTCLKSWIKRDSIQSKSNLIKKSMNFFWSVKFGFTRQS
jgi:hypothetical protein